MKKIILAFSLTVVAGAAMAGNTANTSVNPISMAPPKMVGPFLLINTGGILTPVNSAPTVIKAVKPIGVVIRPAK